MINFIYLAEMSSRRETKNQFQHKKKQKNFIKIYHNLMIIISFTSSSFQMRLSFDTPRKHKRERERENSFNLFTKRKVLSNNNNNNNNKKKRFW